MRRASPPSSNRRRARLGAIAIAASLLVTTASAQSRDTGDAGRRVVAVKEAFANATRAMQAGAHDLVVYAFGLIGVAYRFGGESPEDGLDCSGLVRHVFQQVTGVTLPRTAKEMSRVGGSVAKAELVPGDLVFFNTRRFAFSHVGIYVGDARFVHAPRRGRDVEIASLDNAYWRQRFDGARRLIDAGAPGGTTLAFAEAPVPYTPAEGVFTDLR